MKVVDSTSSKALTATKGMLPELLKDGSTIESYIPYRALWLSGYSDRLEIYFLREQEFESLRRRFLLLMF